MDQAGKDALEDRLTRSVDAYHEAALLYAAVKLDLAGTMGAASRSAEDLAEAYGLSAPHLARFLRGLCLFGLCEERADGSFALTPVGRSLTPDCRLAQKVQIVVEQYWRPWADLVSTLQSGTPAFEQIFGTGVLDWRRTYPEQDALFASFLAKTTQAETQVALAALDVSGSDRVVGIGADAALGTEVQPDADLYLLQGVLQIYGDEQAAAILRKCRAAMRDGARLAIVERLMPDRAADDPAAVMLDLHLMTIYGGRARTLAELETLLDVASLTVLKVTSAGSGLTVIETTISARGAGGNG